MKVTLISPGQDICAFGLRCLSAYLKYYGYKVQIIFLTRHFKERYTESILDEVENLARTSDLIGISLVSNYFDSAVQLTKRLKHKLSTPIIWGGAHPTARPEESLGYADMVALGEAEETLLELSQKMEKGINYHDSAGIWFREGNKIIRNKPRAPILDLDLIPPPDYDLENHFVLDGNKIQPMNSLLVEKYLPIPQSRYITLASRGCIYNCSYCANNLSNYPILKRIRVRSTKHIINELLQVTKKFGFINSIILDDDCFFSIGLEKIKEFCEEYKKNIGLPLYVYGIHPSNFNEEKLNVCVNAGLKGIRMGIQTGSERTNKQLYHRNTPTQKILEITKTVNKYKSVLPFYDFILDNPWETNEDIIKTLSLLVEIPKPYQLFFYSLTFYPGTELYEKAKKEKIIKDDLNDVYRKYFYDFKHTYLNDLFLLFYKYNLPKFLQKLLINRILVATRLPHLVYFLIRIGIRMIELIIKGIKAVLTGNISKIYLFIKNKIILSQNYYQ